MEIIALVWNTFILDPLLNGLVFLYAVLGRNFGITIVVFTIIVRLATLPLTLRQIRSTRKMTELQPKLRVIQQRYAKDRARISQETMKLYRESGVNPIGCLGPLVIQFPIWIGLYMAIIQVLPTSPESLAGLSGHLYSWMPLVNQVVPLNSMFLGLDLAVSDNPAIVQFPMAVLVGGSMWVMQKMSTPLAADPRQESTNRMLLWMMPIMFGFFTLSLPAGLPLYWLVSNAIGIVIQYFVTGWGGLLRSRTAPATVTASAAGEESETEGGSSPDEEVDSDRQRYDRDQRQNRRGGARARPKGARRRSRGGRGRGR